MYFQLTAPSAYIVECAASKVGIVEANLVASSGINEKVDYVICFGRVPHDETPTGAYCVECATVVVGWRIEDFLSELRRCSAPSSLGALIAKIEQIRACVREDDAVLIMRPARPGWLILHDAYVGLSGGSFLIVMQVSVLFVRSFLASRAAVFLPAK